MGAALPTTCLLVLSVASLSLVLGAHNGEALLPPMAWRSWNAFHASISADLIKDTIDALVLTRAADGSPDTSSSKSIFSLGFELVGIDEGWEGCNMGVNGTVHYVNGTPAVSPKFPDMPGLVRYGHSKGVKMGFYLNGCGCTEHTEHLINYEGDVNATIGWGFDGVKIDSCGAQTNMTLYYELFNNTGTPIAIENCHQGRNIPDGGNPGQMGPDWCPYNLWRTSGDIVNVWDRVMSNLFTVSKFLDEDAPVSRPGCWAYPDMLEVGRMVEHNDAESRSHFAAWAVVSAPLVLGFDLRDEKVIKEAWPIISNHEIIEISQTWEAGSPFPSGRLLSSWKANNTPALDLRGSCDSAGGCVDLNANCSRWAKERQCELNPGYMLGNCPKSCGTCSQGDFTGWQFDAAAGTLRQGGLCLDSEGQLSQAAGGDNWMQMRPCVAGQPSQRWAWNTSAGTLQSSDHRCVTVTKTWLWNYVPIVDLKGCNGGDRSAWTLNSNGTVSNADGGCAMVNNASGPLSGIWAKSLSRGRTALVAINAADITQRIAIDFEVLGLGKGDRGVRDAYLHKDFPASSSITRDLGPHDCLVLILGPVSEPALSAAAELLLAA